MPRSKARKCKTHDKLKCFALEQEKIYLVSISRKQKNEFEMIIKNLTTINKGMEKMKKLTIATALVLSLLISTSLFANPEYLNLDDDKYDLVVENYLNGAESENFGLKTSSFYFLGEIEASEAVIPLLSILSDDDEDVRTRITAALSLYKIGDGRGIYRLKTTAKFDDNERLSELTHKFYITHILKEMGYDEEINEESLEEFVQNIGLDDLLN